MMMKKILGMLRPFVDRISVVGLVSVAAVGAWLLYQSDGERCDV